LFGGFLLIFLDDEVFEDEVEVIMVGEGFRFVLKILFDVEIGLFLAELVAVFGEEGLLVNYKIYERLGGTF
jgi:hypothetical protein